MVTTKELIDEIKVLKADFDAAFDLLVQRTDRFEETVKRLELTEKQYEKWVNDSR